MKKIYYMPALLAGMLSLASCNDNEPNGGDKPANPQDAINFNIGQKSASSRTHYAANDWLQIEWDSNDQITIACAQTQAPTSDGKWASKKSANYTVTQVLPNTQKINIDGVEKEVTTNSKAKIAVKDGETALYWGQNNPDSSPRLHTFYAGYGEGITIDDEGVAKCMYDAEQVLVKDANNVWINMKQAYMVAHTEPMTPTDEVSLKFKPIMTTLEVEIQAPSTPIKIKAMEITVPKSQDKIDVIASSQAPTNAYFKYDIAWKSETGETTGKVLPASSPTDEKIIFTLDNTQEVSAGGSIKITAILPPIEISETDKLLITVDATDISNTATFASSVATSAKAVIKSGAWKGPKDAQENVDYVDLDLPSGLKWATCNLGASNPKEYGDYYGWGCTIPYATSADAGTSTNCPLYFKKIGGTGTSLSHCQQGKELDPLTGLESISGTEYDAAHVRLGGKWRMPTQAEVYELMKNCDWVKETQGNEKYWKISSKTNPSKFIYLPLGGRREGYTHSGLASGGQYWNSTPSSENDYNACRIWLHGEEYEWNSYYRCNGFSIRPVYGDITTKEEEDLGLEYMWATCNLGATKEYEYGNYYGWGCTEEYDKNGASDLVNWRLYFSKLGGTATGKDDCGKDGDPLKDFVNNKQSIAETEWDVVKAELGDKWRMPTEKEWNDLIKECTWKWIENYNGDTGVNGYKVTSKHTGVSIFLPAAEYRAGRNPAVPGEYGYYWSSTPYDTDAYGAKSLYFNSHDHNLDSSNKGYRYYGFSIRPVRKY